VNVYEEKSMGASDISGPNTHTEAELRRLLTTGVYDGDGVDSLNGNRQSRLTSTGDKCQAHDIHHDDVASDISGPNTHTEAELRRLLTTGVYDEDFDDDPDADRDGDGVDSLNGNRQSRLTSTGDKCQAHDIHHDIRSTNVYEEKSMGASDISGPNTHTEAELRRLLTTGVQTARASHHKSNASCLRAW
jgi:hypothetical protein